MPPRRMWNTCAQSPAASEKTLRGERYASAAPFVVDPNILHIVFRTRGTHHHQHGAPIHSRGVCISLEDDADMSYMTSYMIWYHIWWPPHMSVWFYMWKGDTRCVTMSLYGAENGIRSKRRHLVGFGRLYNEMWILFRFLCGSQASADAKSSSNMCVFLRPSSELYGYKISHVSMKII